MSWKTRTCQSIIRKAEQLASPLTFVAEFSEMRFLGILASILSLSMIGNTLGVTVPLDIKDKYIIGETYKEKESLNKTIFEDELSYESNRFAELNTKILKLAIAERYYQRAINEIICSMSHGLYIIYEHDRKGNYIRNDIWYSCINKLERLEVAMLKFKRDHIGISKTTDEDIMKCNSKSRLFELEAEFPPYKHLIIDGEEPKAHDAKAFLECVRRRENEL